MAPGRKKGSIFRRVVADEGGPIWVRGPLVWPRSRVGATGMGDRVTVEQKDELYVRLDGRTLWTTTVPMEAAAFAAGLKRGIETHVEIKTVEASPDIVADTARALDEEQDDLDDEEPGEPGEPQGGPLWVGDRFRDDDGDEGEVVSVHDGAIDVRYDNDDFGLIEDLTPGGEWTNLGPKGPAAVPFKVGDRVRDWEGDEGTVVAVDDDGFQIQYDDHCFGDGGWHTFDRQDLGYLKLRLISPAKPSVTPHPDRPDTADGEVPEGWREDCFGILYAPGGMVSYAWKIRAWCVHDALLRSWSGPNQFTLRSEAVARLQELLAEGGRS